MIYAGLARADDSVRPVMTAAGDIFVRRDDRTHQLEHGEELGLRRRGPRPTATDRELGVFVAMSFREEEEPALVDYYRAIERAVGRPFTNVDINRSTPRGVVRLSGIRRHRASACPTRAASKSM